MKSSIVTLSLSLLSTIPAHAAIVSYSFEGTVVEIDGNAKGVVAVGEQVTGSFYYSTALPDLDEDSTYGFYQPNVGDFGSAGLEFGFGGLRFAADSNDLQRLVVNSPTGVFRSGFAFNLLFDADDNHADGSAVFSLEASSPNYFGSDALPSSFNYRDFRPGA